ncbi:MAG: hypothetical protein M0019_03045 [Actinomycetota bacterium]|nr:hypothetical protein [Actinomycetota bacterium]
MARYILRIWLDDRPGALGQVASRIGAVRGDLVGIEILERGAGKAIDEIVVEIPSNDLLDLLIREIHEVDGVDVEDVRESNYNDFDIRLAPLEVATRLLDCEAELLLFEALATNIHATFDLSYAAVIDSLGDRLVAGSGELANEAWLVAFAKGGSVRTDYKDGHAPSDDMFLIGLDFHGHFLICHRDARPLRALERSQIWMLSRICSQHARRLAKI